MTLDVAAVLADAWRMWKRDRDLLLGVAGLFLFLPDMAFELLVPPMPAAPARGADAANFGTWLESVQAWASTYGLIMAVVGLALMFGTLVILTLYLDPQRPNLRVALVHALTLSPRYLAASMLIALPVQFGVLLLFLPGIYALGRLMLTTPALVADRSCGVFRAISRSLSLTGGHGLVLAGIACFTLFGGEILAWPFHSLGGTLDGAPLENPFVAGLLGAGAAAGTTIGMVAAILVEVALYRRLSPNNGI